MPELDPSAMLQNFAASMHCSPDDLRRAADLLAGNRPTLRAALAELDTSATARIENRYPQGYAYFLDGYPTTPPGSGPRAARPAEAGTAVDGFGEVCVDDVTVHAVERARDEICATVRAKALARDGVEPTSVTARTEGARYGIGAAAQYVHAARAVFRLLTDSGVLLADPLRRLSPPRRPGAVRSRALTVSELSEYVLAIVCSGPDPVADALLYTALRVTATRNSELITTTTDFVDLDRATVTVLGKGTRYREQPLHRPILRAVLRLREERVRRGTATGEDTDTTNSLFLGLDGAPITDRRFDAWAIQQKKLLVWTRGSRLGVHTLRHTTARQIQSVIEGPSVIEKVYLGHRADSLGAVATYLRTTSAEEVVLRTEIAERVFGSLDELPVLPEGDLLWPLLRPYLD